MRYKKITQKPYCCMDVYMEMILNRNNINNHGQVDLACKLGLTVPEEYKNEYPNAIISEKPGVGYGTGFKKRNFPLIVSLTIMVLN